MNFIIIILAATAAYLFALIYDAAMGLYAKYELREEQKKRYKDDIYSLKAKKLFITAYNHSLASGLDPKQAFKIASNYMYDLEKNYLVEVKYDLLRGFNERNRNKRSCI